MSTTWKRFLGMAKKPDTQENDDKKNRDYPSTDNTNERADDVDTAETKDADRDTKYPSLKVVLPVMLSVYLATFLSCLDRTIIGIAIPAISNEFKSFGDIGWYESAFLFSYSTLQLPSGKLYTFFPTKWIFLGCVTIFEIGSIVCAAAPSSAAFIVGRLIAGIGGTGILTGASVIIVDLLPLKERPKYLGLLGAVFGLASILGPTIGGVFTSKVTWRWCFWINAPIGGVALIASLIFLPVTPPAPDNLKGTWKEKLAKFDPLGSALMIPGLICILFALQWGGIKYPWDSSRIIALLVVGAVLILGFIPVQFWVKDNGTAPPRIAGQRSIAAGCFVNFGIGGVMIISTFFLPIWFQAIKNISAVDAGVRLLPYFLGTVVFVISSGFLVSKTGYYTPWTIVGNAILVAGMGLWTTFNPNTNTGEWVGYQILLGAGLGLTLQQPINAAQTVLPRSAIPMGITLLSFVNFLSGTIFVTVCQTILSTTLSSKLADRLPGFDASAIANTGATKIRDLVTDPEDVKVVIQAYSESIDLVFVVGAALAGFAFLGSFAMEWRSVRDGEQEEDQEQKGEKNAEDQDEDQEQKEEKK